MAKKDNFDFDTDSKAKFSLDFGFLKNLTQKQKELILMIAIAVILVVVIVIVGVVIFTGDNNGGGNTGGNAGNEGNGESGDGSSNENEDATPEDVIEFYLSSPPTKSEYYIGDAADYSGLVAYIRSATLGSVTVSYDDAPEMFKFTGFDTSKATDELKITVEYAGATDVFTIKVLEHSITQATLLGITVDPLPKTQYKVGKSFNPTGGYIVAEYSDGTTQRIELTLANVVGFGSIANTPGEHQIRIKYSDDHGGYAETYITVTIVEE